MAQEASEVEVPQQPVANALTTVGNQLLTIRDQEDQVVSAPMNIAGGAAPIPLNEINQRLGRIEERLDDFDGRLDDMDGHLDDADLHLDGIDGRLEKIDGRLNRM